jgi:hypothetical protein
MRNSICAAARAFSGGRLSNSKPRQKAGAFFVGASIMLKAPRLSDLQPKPEKWSDALALSGGVIFVVCICAVALVGFHNRDHSIRGTALSVSSGATPHTSL